MVNYLLRPWKKKLKPTCQLSNLYIWGWQKTQRNKVKT